MRAAPIITALFALLCWAKGAESRGWEGLIAHKHSEKELRTTPTITVQKTNGTTVMLLLENRTGVDIQYYGYSEDTPQLFLKEKRDGKWVATSWDWCGTGSEKHVVKNGKTTTFEINVVRRPIQIFTILYNAKDPKEFSLVKLYESDGG